MMALLKLSLPMNNNILKQSGLTLIEVLIALAIISIAFTAILLSTSQNIRNTEYLQSKQTASWVSTAVINQVIAGIMAVPESEAMDGGTEILGRKWFWKAS